MEGIEGGRRHTGEEEVLRGGDTRAAGEGGLQVPEGGRRQGGGAGNSKEDINLRLLKTASFLL